MSERERRLARNEAVFRDVNENIQQVAEQLEGGEHHLYEYCCECANNGCNERVQLTVREYEALRGHSTWFALIDGHDLPEIETVVQRHPRYVVVEKQREAAEVARGTDPRE
jgi:hypothetical protein